MSQNDPDACDDDAVSRPIKKPHPLERYSLRGHAVELRKDVRSTRYVLPGVAASAQLTVINAAPNVGKTLSTLAMLIRSFAQGNVAPDDVFYCNADDTSEGLATKVDIADQLGFHMLAPGLKGFETSDLLKRVKGLVDDGSASRTVLVLDTGKHFVDPMDKRAASIFMGALRGFVMVGGTVIMLMHVNKHPGTDGKPIAAGVSDFKDDADCQYTASEVAVTPDGLRKVIKFERGKSRGYGVSQAFFEYSIDPTLTYPEMVDSFHQLSASDLEDLQREACFADDELIVSELQDALRKRPCLKMELLKGTMKSLRVSRSEVQAVLDRYRGDDPSRHRWTYEVIARGGHLYRLLEDDLKY